jgi:Uma2 family endonuclease
MAATATKYALPGYASAIEALPENGTLTLYDLSWKEYENLLHEYDGVHSLRVSYDDGKVQIMPLSPVHEFYTRFLEQLVGLFSRFCRRKVIHFGSATMKRQSLLKGVEPDASFYIQSCVIIGKKIDLDLEIDPPPDLIIEVDIHNESLSRFPIYAALGVGEIWHYDETRLTIYQLQQGQYVAVPASPALPLLTSAVLTEFLTRCKDEDQYDTLLAFEDWLRSQQP